MGKIMCGQLQSQITNTRSSEIECANLLDPNTPPLLRIRYLDEKLKAIYTRIKHDEVLEKHLENILVHMRQERTLYSFQVQISCHIPTFMHLLIFGLIMNTCFVDQ